jgi:hypothetical protein
MEGMKMEFDFRGTRMKLVDKDQELYEIKDLKVRLTLREYEWLMEQEEFIKDGKFITEIFL